MSLVLIKIKTSSTYRAPKGDEKKQSKTQISKKTGISFCLLGSKGGKAGHTSPSPGVTAPGPTKVRIKKKIAMNVRYSMSLVLIRIKTSSTYRAPKGNEKKQSKTQISKKTRISFCLLCSKGGKTGHTSLSPGVTAPGPTKVRIKKTQNAP